MHLKAGKQEPGAIAVILWNSQSPGWADLFDFHHPDTLPGPVIFVNELVARQLKKQEAKPVHLMTSRVRVSSLYNNIIGYLDNDAQQTIIIGAHYDHPGFNKRGIPRSGADDNASGVALMLELARYLRQQGGSRFNYLFIAFGAEEAGLIGSGYFCSHPTIPLESVACLCNFDMVGHFYYMPWQDLPY